MPPAGAGSCAGELGFFFLSLCPPGERASSSSSYTYEHYTHYKHYEQLSFFSVFFFFFIGGW